MPAPSAISAGNPPSSSSFPSDQRPASKQAPADAQALADFFNLMNSITSSPIYQTAERISNETAGLRNQVQAKKNELEHVRNEMSAEVTAKQTAMSEMFKENAIEKTKQEKAESEIESLTSQIRALEKVIAHKEREMNDTQRQLRELQSDKAKLQSDFTIAHRDIDGLQRKMKEKDAMIEKVKVSYSANQKSLKAAEERAKDVEKEKVALNKSLQAAEARVHKLEGYAVRHSDYAEETMADAFFDLWQYAIIELSPHLNLDFAGSVLQNPAIWDTFTQKTGQHRIPLPHSNSPAAKRMRLAVVLATLAREIDKRIFQPTYIVAEDSELRGILTNLAASDREKESFCRAILLSISPETESINLQSRIQAVVRNVSMLLQLRASIEKIVERAVQVWHHMQRSPQRFEPDFEPLKWDDDQWTSFDVPEGSPAKSEDNAEMPDEILLTVFPRLTVVENNSRVMIAEVVNLMKRHPLCMAAAQEVQELPKSPIVGQRAANRQRRKSNAASNIGQASSTLPGKKKS
ncbi:hypothetical protein BDW74DRAFT_189902 [Aspergillus multicolor]|uniref:uncharacterized protein n=1 Tax=Aspergillus multicolor TaxID=41759 RepID=UPI003CCD3084